MRRRSGLWPAAVLAVMLLPAASASPLMGAFSVSALTVPPATLEVDGLLAILAASDASVQAFDLSASQLQVTRHEWRIQDVALGSQHFTYVLDHESASFPLTNAHVRLSAAEGSGLVFVRSDNAHIEVAERTRFASMDPHVFGDQAVTTKEAPDPRRPSVEFIGPTLSFQGNDVIVSGRLTVHLYGPDIWLESAENTSSIATGSSRGSSPLGERTDRALVLEGEATLALRGALTVRVDRLHGLIDGVMEGETAYGRLQDADETYAGEGDAILLQGRFEASLAPRSDKRLELGLLGGELEATSLAKIAPMGLDRWIPGAWGLLMLGAGGVVLAVAVLERRVSGRRAVHADDLIIEIEDALEEGRLSDALVLLKSAARLAPSSVRLRFDLAYVQWKEGEPEAALDLLAELAHTQEAAEAHLLSARILSEIGRFDEAVAHLVRMLDALPVMLLELDDPAFATLVRDPRLVEAIERARRDIDP